MRHFLSVLSLLVCISGTSSLCVAKERTADPQEIPELRIPCLREHGFQWLPGVHYDLLNRRGARIDDSQPPVVELVEFNHYRGRPSMTLQPAFQEWLKTHSRQVKFVHKPLLTHAHQKLQARMYFTLEQLGRSDLHEKFVRWISDTSVPERHKNYADHYTADEAAAFNYNLQFAVANGITEAQFRNVYASQAMTKKVSLAELDSDTSAAWRGSPTYVVNGRYSTNIGTITPPKEVRTFGNPDFYDKKHYDALLDLINYLVESELQKTYLTETELRDGGLRTCAPKRRGK